MFYLPEVGHDLPHNPFNAGGAAPYSFLTAAAYGPPQILFAST